MGMRAHKGLFTAGCILITFVGSLFVSCKEETVYRKRPHLDVAGVESDTVYRVLSNEDPVNLFFVRDRRPDDDVGKNDEGSKYVAVCWNWAEKRETILRAVKDPAWVDVSADFKTLYEFYRYTESSERPNSYVDNNIRITDLSSGKVEFLFGKDYSEMYNYQGKVDSARIIIHSSALENMSSALFFNTSWGFGRYYAGQLQRVDFYQTNINVFHIIPVSETEMYCHYLERKDMQSGGSKEERAGIYSFKTSSMRELKLRGIDTLLAGTCISRDTRMMLTSRDTSSSGTQFHIQIDLIDSMYCLIHRAVYTTAQGANDIKIDPYGKWIYFIKDDGISRIRVSDIEARESFDEQWFGGHREVVIRWQDPEGTESATVSNLRILKTVGMYK
jgi:hypothetical protein